MKNLRVKGMKLIFRSRNSIKSAGGPAGYLYNLNEGLINIGCDDIVFLPESKKQEKERIKKIIPQKFLNFRDAYLLTQRSKVRINTPVELSNYELIHFHSTDELYQCRYDLQNYKGVVVLTSHSPCARHIELLNTLSQTEKKIFSKKLESLEKIDLYAFKRADYIIFPCKEAEEPYYNTWMDYRSIRIEEKYRYLPTGIKQCFSTINKSQIREKYGIPQDAFIICYVGRHNYIKGYDFLKEIGSELINENIYFLIAGKEEPLQGLNNDHWIEIGWTSDPHSIISAADMFLLPNRETYFDLIMLEVLSLGQIVVASKTGGNKFFLKYNSDGIRLFETKKQAIDLIKYFKDMEKCKKDELCRTNLKLFKDFFNDKKFAENYVQLINSLVLK